MTEPFNLKEKINCQMATFYAYLSMNGVYGLEKSCFQGKYSAPSYVTRNQENSRLTKINRALGIKLL